VAELTARDRVVTHGPSGRTTTYGRIAHLAADTPHRHDRREAGFLADDASQQKLEIRGAGQVIRRWAMGAAVLSRSLGRCGRRVSCGGRRKAAERKAQSRKPAKRGRAAAA
jgi:hypothetical protein